MYIFSEYSELCQIFLFDGYTTPYIYDKNICTNFLLHYKDPLTFVLITFGLDTKYGNHNNGNDNGGRGQGH